jgi:hypothetical protein
MISLDQFGPALWAGLSVGRFDYLSDRLQGRDMYPWDMKYRHPIANTVAQVNRSVEHYRYHGDELYDLGSDLTVQNAHK